MMLSVAFRGRRPGFLLPLCVALATLGGAPVLADCLIDGPGSVCFGTTNLYHAVQGSVTGEVAYQWHLASNSVGAVLLGDTNSSSVEVFSPSNGVFTLRCTISLDT